VKSFTYFSLGSYRFCFLSVVTESTGSLFNDPTVDAKILYYSMAINAVSYL